MRCAICSRSTYIYTGLLNPWYVCQGCGAEYCDRCSRGDLPSYVPTERVYAIASRKECPTCGTPITAKSM